MISTSPTERLAGLVIGTVESVSPEEIRVSLGADSPHATALNTGTPAPFPRLNGYVLIPNESGATVGFISWMGIDRYPQPRGSQAQFGLVDLPVPLRKMAVNPLGTLITRRDSAEITYELSRGVTAFPSVGDQVLIPSPEQVAAIVGANEPGRRIWIGNSPMAQDAQIMVDPDRIFGRHLAVLGNTGSGKSCSVAGMIRWSIDASIAEMKRRGTEGSVNARFIILDPNGEYSRAFSDMDNVRVFRPGAADHPLTLPGWMWNSHEWAAVAQAQPGTQRPLLMQALRYLRAGRAASEEIDVTVARQLHVYRTKFNAFMMDSTGNSYSGFPGNKNAGNVVRNLSATMESLRPRLGDKTKEASLDALIDGAKTLVAAKSRTRGSEIYFDDFSVADFSPFIPLFDAAAAMLPRIASDPDAGEDDPIPFDIRHFADFIDDLAADGTGNANLSSFVAYLTLRIRALLSNKALRPIVAPGDPVTLDGWLNSFVGGDGAKNGQIAIVDLSLVPSEATHIVVAVLARLVFEATQRYRKNHPEGKSLPTTLVLEEAHNFVKRARDDEDGLPSPARLCREAFEKIAREGRKFGLGLLLSSQRPYELSPTILAQCNTFLLHRIVNDNDQDLVRRLVPDNVGTLLRDLPSLPSRQAILLGWATPVPVLVEMRELMKDHRPWSDDPDFWAVWTGQSERAVDWPAIAKAWTGEGKAD